MSQKAAQSSWKENKLKVASHLQPQIRVWHKIYGRKETKESKHLGLQEKEIKRGKACNRQTAFGTFSSQLSQPYDKNDRAIQQTTYLMYPKIAGPT